MVATRELDHEVAAGGGARQADRRHRRLGAGADEPHHLHAGHTPHDQLRQLGFGLGRRAVAGSARRLLLDRGDDARRGVAEDECAPRAHHVGVLAAICVIHRGALAPGDKKKGSPPTPLKARTGLFTPPGRTLRARSNCSVRPSPRPSASIRIAEMPAALSWMRLIGPWSNLAARERGSVDLGELLRAQAPCPAFRAAPGAARRPQPSESQWSGPTGVSEGPPRSGEAPRPQLPRRGGAPPGARKGPRRPNTPTRSSTLERWTPGRAATSGPTSRGTARSRMYRGRPLRRCITPATRSRPRMGFADEVASYHQVRAYGRLGYFRESDHPRGRAGRHCCGQCLRPPPGARSEKKVRHPGGGQ